jgi:peroxiredoxin
MNPRATLTGILAVTLAAMLGYLEWKSSGLDNVPDITVVSTKGEKLPLAHMRGKPLLVTFWASTCSICIEEMPNLIDLYREFSRQGLRIIAIDIFYDPPSLALAMQKSRNIPYTIALDSDARAARAFGDVGVTPTTFLIAPNGRVLYQKAGRINMQRVRDDIITMLKPAQAPHEPGLPAGAGV